MFGRAYQIYHFFEHYVPSFEYKPGCTQRLDIFHARMTRFYGLYGNCLASLNEVYHICGSFFLFLCQDLLHACHRMFCILVVELIKQSHFILLLCHTSQFPFLAGMLMNNNKLGTLPKNLFGSLWKFCLCQLCLQQSYRFQKNKYTRDAINIEILQWN